LGSATFSCNATAARINSIRRTTLRITKFRKLSNARAIKSTYLNNFPNITATYKVAIIGVGPKGMYAFERLLAQLQHTHLPIEIHLINRSSYFGAGDIYNPEQPNYLIMNYHSNNIQMWSAESPYSSVEGQVCFTDWLKKTYVDSAFPKDYAPRAVVGEYLHEGFTLLKNSAAANVKIVCHQLKVEAIKVTANGYCIYGEKDQQPIVLAQQLLLATGHPRPQKTAQRTHYHNFVKDQNERSFTDFVYPVTQQLAEIQAEATVLIKGLGLTFIDSVLCLTEGRGGRFVETDNGTFIYEASGAEPRFIFPFSRSGLPMIPRSPEEHQAKPTLHYFTTEVMVTLKKQETKIDFTTQLLPLIEQDMVVAYYDRLFQQHGKKLTIDDDFQKVEAQIKAFLSEQNIQEKFSLQTLLDPYPPIGNDQAFFLKYLDEVIEAAQSQRPLAVAAGVWRVASAGFNELYSFGGFTPLSHQAFLEGYAGHFNRIAYGPPLRNLLKIKAVAKAGLLDFSFVRSPELHLDKATRSFVLRKGRKAVYGDHLVDARIPKVNLTYEASKLEQSLLIQGVIRLFENKSAEQHYYPGCMELNEKGHPINAKGEVVTSITVYGTPTEGMTFDNDTLSRQRNNFASQWGKHVLYELKQFYKHHPHLPDHQYLTI